MTVRVLDPHPDIYGRYRQGTAERYEAGWHVRYDDEPDLLYQMTDAEVMKRRIKADFPI